MSKFGIRIAIRKELKNINKKIDEKIIKGLPYNKEAKLHKELKARLALLDRTTFMARSMRVATMFTL